MDLAILGRRVNLSGGLKRVERSLGLIRPPELRDLNGLEAVHLWRSYQAGNQSALRTLMRYCRADTEALVRIVPRIVERLSAVDEATRGWIPKRAPVFNRIL